MVVYHLQLTYTMRNRNSQFGRWIHLTIQNFGYCLTTVHPRCPCFYDSGKIFGRPLHTERTSVHQNKNSRFTGCSHFLNQLVLQTYEVDIRSVSSPSVRSFQRKRIIYSPATTILRSALLARAAASATFFGSMLRGSQPWSTKSN